MLIKTEVITLKSMKYRDTSKIVTFYSKKFGKIKGIAKGARSAKNKFGASLEPMTHSMLLIYKKEHRDLHLISQCDAINSFKNISNDLELMTTALSVIELVNKVTHDEEQNERLFALITNTLDALNSNMKNYHAYAQAFRLRLAGLFGFMPNFETCCKCGRSIPQDNYKKPLAFQIARGAVFCNKCYDLRSDSGFTTERTVFASISNPALKVAQKLLAGEWSVLNNLNFDESIGNELDKLTRLYLRQHFDGLKTMKSLDLFKSIN